MRLVVLLLLAILVVMIGGPLALGFTIALPAYLVWASGILEVLFWLVVATVAGGVLLAIHKSMERSGMEVPKGDLVVGDGKRIKCSNCGTERDAAFTKCFKCTKIELNL